MKADDWLVTAISASWTCLQVQRVLIHAHAGTHAIASVSAVVGPTVPSTFASCCSGMMSPLLLFVVAA